MLPIKIELPEHFLDEEMRWGYTVSTEMKKVWAVELDLLHEFQSLCKQYTLRYFSFGGTLLGAVRHEGFIPWDDDIDVFMLREDYDNLLSIVPNVLNKPYVFQTSRMDENCFRGHAQLRNSYTTGILRSEYSQKYKFNQGIFIDIFVFDFVPSNKLNREFQYGKMKFYRKILLNKVSCIHNSIKGKILHCILDCLENMGMDFQKVFYRYEELARKLSTNPTEYIAQIELKTPPEFMIKFSDIGRGIKLPFEFMQVMAPENYDSVLRSQYGDYKTPICSPSTHGDVIFDPERPYTDYLNNVCLPFNKHDENVEDKGVL